MSAFLLIRSFIDSVCVGCVRCPAALDLMNEEAAKHPEIQFVACAMTLGEGNDKAVAKLVPK